MKGGIKMTLKIEFYIDEDWGIEMGGVFVQGYKAVYAEDEAHARQLNNYFKQGNTINDCAAWAIHNFTGLQVEMIREEKILYKF